MIELKINDGKHRENVVIALAESGYMVKVDERKSSRGFSLKDYFVQVMDEQQNDKPAKEEQPAFVEVKPASNTDPIRTIMIHAPNEDIKAPRLQLIFYKCPGCGAVQFKYANEGDTDTCHYCGENVKLDNLIPGEYECPKCNFQSKFFTSGKVDTVRCKRCRSDVDLKYVVGLRKMMSVNNIIHE